MRIQNLESNPIAVLLPQTSRQNNARQQRTAPNALGNTATLNVGASATVDISATGQHLSVLYGREHLDLEKLYAAIDELWAQRVERYTQLGKNPNEIRDSVLNVFIDISLSILAPEVRETFSEEDRMHLFYALRFGVLAEDARYKQDPSLPSHTNRNLMLSAYQKLQEAKTTGVDGFVDFQLMFKDALIQANKDSLDCDEEELETYELILDALEQEADASKTNINTELFKRLEDMHRIVTTQEKIDQLMLSTES